MKKNALKISLSLLLIMPWGCNTDDCGDLSGGPGYYNITGFAVANVRLLEGGYSVEENITANSSIPYHRYGLSLQPVVEYVSMQKERKPSLNIFPAAYACSPAPPQPTEKIADIAIFSNADYVQANSTKVIAAGDTLNAVFNIYDRYSGRIVGLPDFLVDENVMASDEWIIFQPSSPPAEAQTHEFTVHYRLENGEFYNITARPIILTP